MKMAIFGIEIKADWSAKPQQTIQPVTKPLVNNVTEEIVVCTCDVVGRTCRQNGLPQMTDVSVEL
jgi:hypothetical protein